MSKLDPNIPPPGEEIDKKVSLLLEFDRPREAMQLALKHLAQHPSSISATIGLARVAAYDGFYADALTHYDRVLSMDPENWNATYGRAMTLRRLNRDREALEVLDELLAESPEHPTLLTRRAETLSILSQERFLDGKEQRALELRAEAALEKAHDAIQ